MDLIDLDLLMAAIPSLSRTDADLLLPAVNSEVRRALPSLLDIVTDPGLWAEAVYIVIEALKRPARWIESEQAGLFQVRYRTVLSGKGTVLDASDVAALQALCGSRPVNGLSRGSFPEPSGIEGLHLRLHY